MICTSCTLTFLQDPIRMSIVIVSFLLAMFFFFMSRKNFEAKKKLGLIYLHIFFLIFPFVFYIFFNGCTAFLNSCHQLAPMILVVIVSFASSMAFVALLGPVLFIKRHMKKSHFVKDGFIFNKVRIYSEKLNISKPKVYLVDIAKPIAFSISTFKSKIFISIGLLDLLNKKEIEAVLLHELGHVKNNSSAVKFWSIFARYLTPLANFDTLHNYINEEELKADEVVLKFQQSSKFLDSAKRKINNFISFEDSIQK